MSFHLPRHRASRALVGVYFEWRETRWLFGRARAALVDNGLLLFRVNSVDDVNYGATGFPEIEPNCYRVGERTKRFFDERAVDTLFSEGWSVLSRERRTIGRYGAPKSVWEVVATRAPMEESKRAEC